MGLALFFAAMVVVGREAAYRIRQYPRDEAGPFERALTTALFALAFTLALSWALALPKLLTRGGLALGGAFLFACAVAAWWRRSRPELRGVASRARAMVARFRSASGGEVDGETLCRLIVLVGVLALVASGAFFMWRSAVVFTPSHDAAAYHLPKAAMMIRAHGYETFDGTDVRLTNWPCDYELLLADEILLDRGDAHAGWVSVAALAFFLLAVAAVAERWWGRGRHVLVPVLLAAAMPIVLLHSDAHKNDVLMAALFVTAITFGARWAAAGGGGSLAVALTSVALALGTKGSAFFLVAALGPLAVWGCVRHWRAGARPNPASIAAWCVAGVVLFLALGGAVYVRNAMETGSPLGPYAPAKAGGYGEWANLVRFPYLAFARPFSASADNVWVPWRGQYWHWGRYDLYFSEWGLPSSLLALALPFGVARYARRSANGSASVAERIAGSLVFLLAFLLILPIHLVPLGFYAAFIRYTLFFPVVLSLWTACPALLELDERGGRWRVGAALGLAATVATFGAYVMKEVKNDLLEPLDYVLWIADHPEERRRHRSAWNNRAGVLVDRVAGPEDAIAFDGAIDSWTYYCYGADLRRSVLYLHPERGLPVAVPDEAKWVVIDRIGSIAFGHPGFRDFGDWNEYLMKGTSTPEELAVFDQLSNDPRFKLVYRLKEMNQAIFQRVAP